MVFGCFEIEDGPLLKLFRRQCEEGRLRSCIVVFWNQSWCSTVTDIVLHVMVNVSKRLFV